MPFRVIPSVLQCVLLHLVYDSRVMRASDMTFGLI